MGRLELNSTVHAGRIGNWGNGVRWIQEKANKLPVLASSSNTNRAR